MRTLGDTGIAVSPLCLGTMMLGAWGNPDHDEGVRVIHAALDAGVNFVDTADVYSAGESEEIVAKALKGRRDEVVLATKFHGSMGADPNSRGNSRRWIMQEVEHSLRRLGTDRIDLYQAHRPDPSCGIDETLGALSDLVHQGKVRAIGSSAYPAELIVEAQWTAERRGRERFVTEQPPYSIFARAAENAVLPTCARHRMGVLSFSPLNGGWLSGRHRRATEATPSARMTRMPQRYDQTRPENQRKLDVIEELAGVADEAGCSLTALALGFVLAHPSVTSAIVGPRTHEQLVELLAASTVRLDDAVLDRIDALVPPGTNISVEEVSYQPPAIIDARLRRRAGLPS